MISGPPGIFIEERYTEHSRCRKMIEAGLMTEAGLLAMPQNIRNNK
jgi:hypothetical protein